MPRARSTGRRLKRTKENRKREINEGESLDMEKMMKNLAKVVHRRYKPSLFQCVGNIFGNIAIVFIICLAIIFRPLNLLIIGIIALIILLII